MKYSILCAFIGSILLVGCGGEGSNHLSNNNNEKPVTEDKKIKEISGQVDGYQDSKAKFVEILSADGKIYNSEINSQGRYSILDEVLFPYIVRVKQNDDTYIYAVPKNDTSSDIINLNKISNLLVLTLSPNHRAENLWGLESNERVNIIINSYKAASQKVNDSIAPVLSSLNVASIDALNQQYEIGKSEIDNILDNIHVVVNTSIGTTYPIIALSVAATPNNITLWDNSFEKNVLLLTNTDNVVDFGKIENSAEKHYEDIKTSASKYDPKDIDQNKVEALIVQFQKEIQKDSPSMEKLYSLLRDLMVATAVPINIVDEIINTSKNGESIDKIGDLIGKAYGQDLSKEIEKYKNMTVETVSKDARNKTITLKITLDGISQLVTWSVNGQVSDSLDMHQANASSCIQDIYVGTTTGTITPEYYIRNSVFKNKCNQDLNYTSCIWVGAATGGAYCKDIVTKSVKAYSSTELYNVVAGPLLESRVFFACQAPSLPTLVDDKQAFQLKYRCS